MKGPIQALSFSVMVHATEDQGRILRCIAQLSGTDRTPVLELMEGHFGNRIVMANLHLTGQEAEAAFDSVIGGLPSGARAELLSHLEDSVDEHQALYIRLDKQELVRGRLALSPSDPVRVKVKPRLRSLSDGAIRFYRERLGKDG